jgi:type I restriction enzyme R subunit
VFGDVIHTYDIQLSQDDKATVPIYYEPRQIKLHLSEADIDAALEEMVADADADSVERRKSRWAALAAAAGAKDRVDKLAKDLLEHFVDRTATLKGKAMVVCMTRENCVRMYDALTALPNCPEIKVVMTGNLSVDPPEWSAAGHITTKQQRDGIKERIIDEDDPLAMVMVCDMWLTGTDIPCLHTLYVDKPMRGHNMIQAISRVNRVFRDKPHGLVVDYIGVGEQLREATSRYTSGGGQGTPAPEVEETAKPMFLGLMAEVRNLLPEGHDFGAWRRMSGIETEDMYALVYGHLAEDDELRNQFLLAEKKLTSAFILVKHLPECRKLADEVTFYQRVRKQIRKSMPGQRPESDVERAVRDLVDDTVETEGVVDIYAAAGLPRAEISILDDAFLQTFKDRPHENLRLKLLGKLVRDEIALRRPRNLAKARSFKEMLEETLKKYHNRLIDAATVVKVMIQIRREMESDEARAKALNLAEEELAFYDAIHDRLAENYDDAFLCDLIHDIVQSIKRNLKVDWTQSHREDVKAEVSAAVKRVLRRRGITKEHFQPLVTIIMEQAEELYAGWPVAA